MQSGQRACRIDPENSTKGVGPRRTNLEDSTRVVRPSAEGCPIEVAVVALDKPSDGEGTVGGNAAQLIQCGEGPGGTNLEHSARGVHSSTRSDPVEVAVAALDKPPIEENAVTSAKLIFRGQRSCRI